MKAVTIVQNQRSIERKASNYKLFKLRDKKKKVKG